MKNSNKWSLKKKLLLLILPLMVVIVTLVMAINFKSTKSIITKSTYQELEKESNYNVKVIEAWKERILSSLDSVKNTLETIPFTSEKEELNYLTSVTNQLINSIPNGIYEGASDGTYLDGSGWEPDDDYIISERDWYKEGLTNENFEFGAPYLDANTGSFIVSASTHIKRNDIKDLVAAVDIPLDDIT